MDDYTAVKEEMAEEYDYSEYQYDADQGSFDQGEDFDEDYSEPSKSKSGKFAHLLFGGLDPQLVHSHRTILLAFVAVWLTAFCFMRYRQKMGKARPHHESDVPSADDERVTVFEASPEGLAEKQSNEDNTNLQEKERLPKECLTPDPVEEILKTLSVSDSSMGFAKSSLL